MQVAVSNYIQKYKILAASFLLCFLGLVEFSYGLTVYSHPPTCTSNPAFGLSKVRDLELPIYFDNSTGRDHIQPITVEWPISRDSYYQITDENRKNSGVNGVVDTSKEVQIEAMKLELRTIAECTVDTIFWLFNVECLSDKSGKECPAIYQRSSDTVLEFRADYGIKVGGYMPFGLHWELVKARFKVTVVTNGNERTTDGWVGVRLLSLEDGSHRQRDIQFLLNSQTSGIHRSWKKRDIVSVAIKGFDELHVGDRIEEEFSILNTNNQFYKDYL